MKVIVEVTNIMWDTDNEEVNLPTEVTIEGMEEKSCEEMEDDILDFLCETYGYCVYYYEYEVKPMRGKYSKQAAEVSSQYKLSDKDELYKAYGRCSAEKMRAWEHCKKLCHDYNGWGLKVLGANCYQFSAGFLFTDEETGVRRIMKITKSGHTAYDYI